MNRHLRFIAGREPSSDSTEGEEAGTRGRKNASKKSKQKTNKKSKLNVTKYLMKEIKSVHGTLALRDLGADDVDFEIKS